MLREDTVKAIQSAIARGESVTPTPDAVRAIQREAGKLRAQAMRDAFRNGFSWLFRNRDIHLPPGRIDAVRGH
jgi:hypothetical protein